MTRSYRNYSKEDVREAVANNKSIANVLRALGLVAVGGNYQTIKQHIAEMDLDISHHTGQGWNKENYLDRSKIKSKGAIKEHLLRERGHMCEQCYCTTWNGIPITIELEHVDGNRMNDDDTNLKLLCPNCHSQTPTWRRRKSSL